LYLLAAQGVKGKKEWEYGVISWRGERNIIKKKR
jgi:hypothetical protein